MEKQYTTRRKKYKRRRKKKKVASRAHKQEHQVLRASCYHRRRRRATNLQTFTFSSLSTNARGELAQRSLWNRKYRCLHALRESDKTFPHKYCAAKIARSSFCLGTYNVRGFLSLDYIPFLSSTVHGWPMPVITRALRRPDLKRSAKRNSIGTESLCQPCSFLAST